MDPLDRHRGCLLGLSTGDALGTTLEFRPPGSFEPITDIIGGGPFNLKPGQWTDDTSMALCLAESLVECKGFDPVDQLRRYVRWWRTGHLSVTGTCFDIGMTTSAALERFEQTGEPYCGSSHSRSSGNGSIMRLGPVPLFFSSDPTNAVEMSGQSSRTTHGSRECVDACRYLGGLIVGAATGADKRELLEPLYSPMPGWWERHPLTTTIDEVARGSFKWKVPPHIKGTGHVVKSLEAALWAFHQTTTFSGGALLAVNLGDDADTTGAVYGQLAGAYYGVEGIPKDWLDKLAMRDVIERMAERLWEGAKVACGGS
jgi:ADP-ribosylglycohydrolase